MKSVVLIVPATLREASNLLGEAMDWGPDSYSVNLGSHWGLHTWADQSFVDLLEAAKNGQKPASLTDFPDETYAAIAAALIVSVRDTSEGHFDSVLGQHGLVREDTEPLER